MSVSSVLIVDDDETTHEVLGSYLELAGYRVLHAHDGRQGLTSIREQQPDLVLMDVQMPEMDGFQTLEQLRRDRAFAELPVLMLTSLDRPNLKVKGLELGAEDFITKPFNKAELLARIKVALRRAGKFRPAPGTMQGELIDISLPEMLQTLELGRKTARVVFPEMDGEIWLLKGALVQSSQGRNQGEDAIQRLFLLGRGSFVVKFDLLPDTEVGAGRNLTHIVMNAATTADEVRALLGPLAAENPILDRAAGAELAALGEDADLLPLPLWDLLVRRPGELRAATESLLGLVRSGELIAVA